MTEKEERTETMHYILTKMDKLKFIDKAIYKTSPVLVDYYQHHKTKKPLGYIAIIECINPWSTNVGFFKYNGGPIEEAEKMVVVRYLMDWQVGPMIQQLWQVANHLGIDVYDGQNVAWQFDDARRWLIQQNKKWKYDIEFYV